METWPLARSNFARLGLWQEVTLEDLPSGKQVQAVATHPVGVPMLDFIPSLRLR